MMLFIYHDAVHLILPQTQAKFRAQYKQMHFREYNKCNTQNIKHYPSKMGYRTAESFEIIYSKNTEISPGGWGAFE